MISAPLANDSSCVAKNTTDIATKHFTGLNIEGRRKTELEQNLDYIGKTPITLSSVRDG